MTGAALHTKYRPTTIDEVVGQAHIKDGLSAQLAARRDQVFLFEGPSGTGKTTLARICASELGCTDVTEIDAASHTGVDAMREVSSRANFKSLDGGGKAFIVDECHRLSKQAWESLLKAIEEPPEGVYWFFCTTEGEKLMKSVRTRCLTHTLRDVAYKPILRLLDQVAKAEGIDVSEDILDICADEAAGSPRQGLVNLASVAHTTTVDEARAALRREPGSKESIDLARLMSKQWSLADAVKICAEIKTENPESVRMTVYHYFLAAVLGGSLKPGLIVLDEFEKPCEERNKIGDIVIRLARIKKRTDQ